MVLLSLSGTVGFKPKIIAKAEAVVKNREIAVKKAINPIYFSNCVTSLLGNLSEQMPLIGRFFVSIWLLITGSSLPLLVLVLKLSTSRWM